MNVRDVIYSHKDLRLVGHLAWEDASPVRRPGVLVVHDAFGFGPFPVKRAEALARLGYVALAVDMFGDRKRFMDLPSAMAQIAEVSRDSVDLRGRIHAGLGVLQADPRVDAGRVAAIGFCFGGMVVLELARSGADVAGVVSFHGSLKPAGPVEGQIRSRILVCHGAADPVVPDDQVAAFQAEMRSAAADWQMNIYGGAQHAFTNEFLPKGSVPGAEYDEAADRSSWSAMRFFLEATFGPAT